MNELQKAERLKKIAQEYVRELKKYQKIMEKSNELFNSNASRSQTNRNRDARHTSGEHIERLKHEMHCLCVELEIAKYEEWRYGDSKTSALIGHLNNGQHVYKRKPNK